MTIYICQGRYTAAAVKGMMQKPENRYEAVAELFRTAGGKLLSWYLTFGRYDWLLIAEAPNERAMVAAALAAAGGGSLTDLTTTVALTAEESVQAFAQANELAKSFRSAGQEGEYYGANWS
jgi:uncharacterized protein with GYD domain